MRSLYLPPRVRTVKIFALNDALLGLCMSARPDIMCVVVS